MLGTSGRRATHGNPVIRSLQQQGYAGRILPVYPQATELEGLSVVPSIEALPPDVNVAFVALPAADVAGVCEPLDRAGVRAAVVITAGFTPGQEVALRDVAGRVAMLVHGSNCMGVLNLSDGWRSTPPRPVPATAFCEDTSGKPAAHLVRAGA